MSRFDQNSQNVNTQINIASSENSYCSLWITTPEGEESIFLALVSKAPKTDLKILDVIGALIEGVQAIQLIQDPEYNVFIDNEFSDTLRIGETKKFDITQGKHTVEIKLNITEIRKNMGAKWIDAAFTIFNRGNNTVSFPINPGETIDLIYEKHSLRLKR